MAAGDGGAAVLERVYGRSDGGEVRVGAAAVGGAGGDGREDSPAGDGASVHLRNAVDGETPGDLLLSQAAQGGEPGLAGRTKT